MTPGTSGLLPPAPTPQGGGYGQIAFASDKIGIMQVWLLDVANPKKQRQITDRQDGACQPTWSPDGMRLAFISPCKGKQDTYPGSNIFIMNVDAVGNPDRSSVMQITSNLEGDFDPAWSPDGTRIAYTSLVNGKTSIMVINLNDHTTQELSNSRDPDKHPSWSPSGMRLAYVRQVFYNSQVWTMTDNGQLQVQFTQPAPVNNLWPTWSNDEQIIFYSQLPVSPNSTIPILVYKSFEDRDKRAENRIIPAGQQGSAAPVAQVRMSPDGFWLAYESWPDGINHDIYIMNVNGSNQKQLTTDPGHDFGPTWRPVQAIAQP
jgi:Tol biopolymer transport system component